MARCSRKAVDGVAAGGEGFALALPPRCEHLDTLFGRGLLLLQRQCVLFALLMERGSFVQVFGVALAVNGELFFADAKLMEPAFETGQVLGGRQIGRASCRERV